MRDLGSYLEGERCRGFGGGFLDYGGELGIIGWRNRCDYHIFFGHLGGVDGFGEAAVDASAMEGREEVGGLRGACTFRDNAPGWRVLESPEEQPLTFSSRRGPADVFCRGKDAGDSRTKNGVV